MAAGGGDGSTFLFDTNIESIVPRITQGLQGVQKAVNAASKGATTKLTSNLPRDLSRLAADAEQQMQKLEKALQGGKLKGTLGAGYGKIIADLNQKIGSLTQGRGLTLDVGIKFQEAALKQVLERAQRRLSEVENSTQA